MGKVKIPIQKIENPSSRQVCFSKRRSGIFKKASELAILCGAEIAIIVHSPAGKAFTFGSPDIDFVIDKYQHIPVNIDNEKVQRVRRSEQQYNSILRELDLEKKRTDKLKRQERNEDTNVWWTKDIENLQLPELLEFRDSLKTFQERIIRVAQEKESINSFAQKAPNEMEDAQIPQQSFYFQHGDTESTRQTSPSFGSASGIQYHSASQDEERMLNTIDPWSDQDLYQPMMGSSFNGSTEAMDNTLMPFNTALQQSNVSMQDNNAALEVPFLTSQNPSFPTHWIPSYLLVPDEVCPPLSTEISELDRLVMADKQYSLPDVDVGYNDYHIQNSNIRENEFLDPGHRVENTFKMDKTWGSKHPV